MKENIFTKLGTTMELSALGVTPDAMSADVVYTYNDVDQDLQDHLVENVYTKIAASFADLFRNVDSHAYAPEILVLSKVASANKDNWNSYFQDVVSTCVNAAVDSIGSIKCASGAMASNMAKILPVAAGSFPGVALAAIPIIGALLAGSAYFAEKGVNEDTAEVEKQKAKNIAYRTLSADVARRLRDEGLSLLPEDKYVSYESIAR